MSGTHFTVATTATTLGIEPRRVRAAITAGIITPVRDDRRRYLLTFDDLVVMRMIVGLMDHGIPLWRIANAVDSVRKDLPNSVDLSEVVLDVNGSDIFVSFDGERWEPNTGQTTFAFDGARDDAVVVTFERLRRVDGPPGDADAETWFLRGDAIEREDPEAAERAYRAAVEADPTHVEAHLNLGRLLHARGDVDTALDHYAAAVHLDPEDPTAWFNLGVAYEDTGKSREAIAGYERALAVEPAFADAHYNLAALYKAEGSDLAALRHRREYDRLSPG